jgi:hypothetical protein
MFLPQDIKIWYMDLKDRDAVHRSWINCFYAQLKGYKTPKYYNPISRSEGL